MSAYKVIQVIGSSPNSWEEAARTAIEEAGKHLHDLRIAEIEKLDMRIENNKVMEFRVRVNLSFRYQGSPA
jgi:flavin-binding protein dodecin